MMNQEYHQFVPCRSEVVQHILDTTYHDLLAFDFNPPILEKEPKLIQSQAIGKLIESQSSVEGVLHTLRILKMKEKKKKQHTSKYVETSTTKLDDLTFCRPVKELLKDEKSFWLVKGNNTKKLRLDDPMGVAVLPNGYLLTIQRKYINLYQIEDNLDINLKDFDSSGIGKKIILVDIKWTKFNEKDYVIIFRNEKQHMKIFFQALIFQVTENRLRFVKKSNIFDKQVISPIIIFQNYQSKKGEEPFCLIMGGKDNNLDTYYQVLQINLHIFLSQFLTYDISSTFIVPFKNKINILAGKAIKHEHQWYVFCTQEQNVNQITLQYKGNGVLADIDIKQAKLDFNNKVFFSHDSVHSFYDGNEDKIVLLDKNLHLVYKSLQKIIWLFN